MLSGHLESSFCLSEKKKKIKAEDFDPCYTHFCLVWTLKSPFFLQQLVIANRTVKKCCNKVTS